MQLKMSFGYTSILVLAGCLAHFARSQYDYPPDEDVRCKENECPNEEMCLKRDGPGNITYICLCGEERRESGYNCHSEPSPHKRWKACYGIGCQSGSFASPNYPQNYETRDDALMALYIPHAVAIHFEFSSPFGIEEGKDGLYVGTGLDITYGEITATPPREGLLFFHGSHPSPSNFTLETDTAIIYFSSDNSVTSAGFQINWTATVDYTRPEILSCPSSEEFFVRKDEPWKYLDLMDPPVFDPDGQEIYKDADLPEGNRFPVGSTMVIYVYADVYNNSDVCGYSVHVTVDDIPPVFSGCPADLLINATYPNGTVEVDWVEPNVTDNSGEILSLNSSRSPGDSFENGTTLVEYTALDAYGNEEHCRFTVTVEGVEGEPPRSVINDLLPLIICGVLFTLISCVCCLGRTAKASRSSSKATSSKSNQQLNSSSGTRKTSGQQRSGAKLSVSSSVFDNYSNSVSFSESSSCDVTTPSSDSSGYSTAGKSLEPIDEFGGTAL